MASGFRTGLIVVVAFAAGVALYPGFSLFAPKGALKEEHGSGQAARQLWTCGMHPQVIQDKPGDCPICHMKLTPLAAETPGGEAGKTKERRILYYWDPMMSPPYLSEKPGKSPMGMDLVPRYADEDAAGDAVRIDPVVVQNMGVRTAPVTEGPLRTTIRAVGYLHEAQPLKRDVSLKIGGRVERIFADAEGIAVEAGDPLIELYAAELQIAQAELQAARRSADALSSDAAPALHAEAEALLASARRKLELWDVPADSIEATLAGAPADGRVVFRSPAGGQIVEKGVVAGTSVEAGMTLYRITDHSTVWLEAHVYEYQLPFVRVGLPVRATIEKAVPGRVFEGSVVLLHPHVDPETRTVAVRVALANPDLALRPGMFATVEIPGEAAPRAVRVPREAVIDTGVRQIAFVPLEEGRFQPRLVRTGIETEDGFVQILQGLAPGESVVTSGQFLLDVESRTREAVQKYMAERLVGKSGSPGVQESGSPVVATAVVPASGHEGHAGHATHADPGAGATPPAEATAGPLTPLVDGLLAAYLELGQALADERKESVAPARGRLAEAAKALADKAAGGPRDEAAAAVRKAAEALPADDAGAARTAFKDVSRTFIALLDAEPPSVAAAEQVVVVHCPMVAAEWLQRGEDVANPYDPSMRLCGDVVRAVRKAR